MLLSIETAPPIIQMFFIFIVTIVVGTVITKIIDAVDSLARSQTQTTTTTVFKFPEIVVPLEMPEVRPIKETKTVLHKITVTQEEILSLVAEGLDDANIFGKTFEVKKVSELFYPNANGSFEIEVEVEVSD